MQPVSISSQTYTIPVIAGRGYRTCRHAGGQASGDRLLAAREPGVGDPLANTRSGRRGAPLPP